MIKKRKPGVTVALLSALLSASLLALLSACPVDNDDNTEPEPALKLTITQSGRYLNNTVVEMEASDDMASIYYTTDGSEPTEESERYNYVNKPRMQFFNPNTGEMLAAKITIKAVAIDDAGLKSRAVTSEYLPLAVDESVLSDRMKALVAAWKNMSGGTSPDNPITARLPATITVEDVRLQAPSDESPNALVVDGLGSLFVAIAASEKYVALDLSDVVWKGPDPVSSEANPPLIEQIPLCHTTMYTIRPGLDKLVSVKFPAGIEVVGPNAFRAIPGLKLADFTGCSKLKSIEQYAFANCGNLEEVKLNGCGALNTLEQYAFSANTSLRYFDFSETSLASVKNNAVQNAYNMRYIEFPETLVMLGDYCFQRPYNLNYVRFRSEKFRPYFGWCAFLYWMDATDGLLNRWNGMTATHRASQPEGGKRVATDKNFVIFAPDAPYWTSGKSNLFYFNAGASYHHGQHVSLPRKDQDGYAALNALRGDALLAAQEPYRGLASVTLNFTGITDAGGLVNGTIVAKAVSGLGAGKTVAGADPQRVAPLGTAAISGGSGSITLGAPDAGSLNVMNEFNTQALTGRYYRGADETDQDSTIEYNAYVPVYKGEIEGIGETHDTEPHTWPRDRVKFAVLELEIQNAQGENAGYLQQYAESEWYDVHNTPSESRWCIDRRTVRYVWVSENCNIYRMTNFTKIYPQAVWITLKQGWNLWDTAYWRYSDDNQPPGKHFTINIISSGKIPWQDRTRLPDDTGAPPEPTAPWNNPVIWKPIPWIWTAAPFVYPD